MRKILMAYLSAALSFGLYRAPRRAHRAHRREKVLDEFDLRRLQAAEEKRQRRAERNKGVRGGVEK